MAATKGFFSIVQFCPDLVREETANVGVILVVPGLNFFGVKFSEDNEGPKQRFGKEAFDDTRLSLTKRSLEKQLCREVVTWSTPEALTAFAKKEGNNFLFTPPRVALVEDGAAELKELYQKVVHVEAKPHRRRQRRPNLKVLFEPKVGDLPQLRRDLHVEVPQMGTLDVPYAYKNGRLNLIHPEGFPVEEKAANNKANDLAVKGRILFKHPDENGEERQLIIVGGFDPSTPEALKRRIDFVLREQDARLVREEDLDAFAEEVRREAHD